MSDEGQDVELRVLVAQTLENNGVLSKIRAELRAGVFLALEEQDGAVKSQILNKPFKEFVSSVEGSLTLSLVRELLEFFELTYTLSVFDPETRCGKDYSYNGRNQLVKDLKIKNLDSRKGPLLVEILRLAQGLATDRDETLTKTNRSTGNAEEKQSNHVDNNAVEEKSPDHSASNHLDSVQSSVVSNHSISVHTLNGTNLHANEPDDSLSNSTTKSPSNKIENISRPLNERIDDGRNSSLTTLNTKMQDNIAPKDKSLAFSKARDDTTAKPDVAKPASSTFPLLGNLPPLLNTGKTNNFKKTQGKDLNALNSELLSLGLSDSPDNYDEDFHSSVSAGSIADEPGKESDSEIEEEIISNHSVVDDVVLDTTLSNYSSTGLGDHIEDISTHSEGSNATGTSPKVNVKPK